MSDNKSHSPFQVSSNNISEVLSSNMIGCFLQFVKLNSLPTLGTLNKKFKRVIFNEKKLPLYKEFIEERRHSRYLTDSREVFRVEDSKNTYISELRNKLLEKNILSPK